jgi:hypothetical protein
MSEWRVRLKGHQYDLETLSFRLHGVGQRIISEGDSYYLISSYFADLSEASDVHRSASTLIEHLNGIGKLLVGDFSRIELDAVTLVQDDGSRQNFVFLSGTLQERSRMMATLTVVDKAGYVKEEKASRPSTMEAALDIAIFDEAVAKVLEPVQ